METKRDRFIRIAESRTQKILDMLRLLGNCSSRANYDYTSRDVQIIFNTLEQELQNTRDKFEGGAIRGSKFTLK